MYINILSKTHLVPPLGLFRCRADTGVGSRSCGVMEDVAVLDQTEDEELPPQDQDGDPGDEWDTDLETDGRLQ